LSVGTPAEQLLALLAHRLLEEALARLAAGAIGRQKHRTHRVASRRGELDLELVRFLDEEIVRRLHQDARAVTGVGLAAAGTAVLQVQQHLNALLDDVAGLAALDVDDEPDAARVVLVLRVVKSLGRGGSPARLAVSKLSHRTQTLLKPRNYPMGKSETSHCSTVWFNPSRFLTCTSAKKQRGNTTVTERRHSIIRQ
jgi:hypothetical protein